MSGKSASGFQSRSIIEISIGQVPNEAPPEFQKWLGPVYAALSNIVDGLQIYAGLANHNPANMVGQPKASQMFAGLNSRIYVKAGEQLTPGTVVSFLKLTTSDEIVAMKAKATSGSSVNPLPPIGIVTSTKPADVGTPVEVTCGVGIIRTVKGLEPGKSYYLSTEAGKLALSNGAPFSRILTSGTYTWSIPIGVALAPTVLLMNVVPT